MIRALGRNPEKSLKLLEEFRKHQKGRS